MSNDNSTSWHEGRNILHAESETRNWRIDMLRIIIAATVILVALNGGAATEALAALFGLPVDYLVAALIAIAVTPLVTPWFH